MAEDAKTNTESQGQSSGNGNAPVIIVKKKKNRGGHPHHGGAWKVAYADFVTAMMAFFLLLWLLATTTEEQKAGIASYFNPPNNATQYGGGTGIMGGSSVIDTQSHAPKDTPLIPPVADMNEDLAVQAREDAMFKQVAEELKKSVMNIPQLKALIDNMMVDMTPEGLRITLNDSLGRPLFEDGSAQMHEYTKTMLGVVANVLSPLSNRLSIGGHTDVVPYRGSNPAYTNWELSADRAQASRKMLMQEGIPERRVGRVAGYASQEPLLVDQPESVKNRRITIVVLRSNRGALAKFSQEGLLTPQAGDSF